MRARSKIPAAPVLNDDLTKKLGRPVYKIDVLPVEPGDELTLSFKGQSGPWRQGVWLGVEGKLEINGVGRDQLTVWTDTAPRSVRVNILETEDGLLRLYNVWDSGRGRRRESQSHTSGMLKEEVDGCLIYRANDIGLEPAFDKLIFEVRRNQV